MFNIILFVCVLVEGMMIYVLFQGAMKQKKDILELNKRKMDKE